MEKGSARKTFTANINEIYIYIYIKRKIFNANIYKKYSIRKKKGI